MLRRRAALALRAARSAAPAEAHVLQSPGAPRRLLLSLLAQAGCLLAVRMVAPARAAAVEAALAAQLAALSAARNLQLWGVLSALASACCAAQLALSALSLGCSGLNARLGPLRPHALAFAAILQAAQVRRAPQGESERRGLGVLARPSLGESIAFEARCDAGDEMTFVQLRASRSL